MGLLYLWNQTELCRWGLARPWICLVFLVEGPSRSTSPSHGLALLLRPRTCWPPWGKSTTCQLTLKASSSGPGKTGNQTVEASPEHINCFFCLGQLLHTSSLEEMRSLPLPLSATDRNGGGEVHNIVQAERLKQTCDSSRLSGSDLCLFPFSKNKRDPAEVGCYKKQRGPWFFPRGRKPGGLLVKNLMKRGRRPKLQESAMAGAPRRSFQIGASNKETAI